VVLDTNDWDVVGGSLMKLMIRIEWNAGNRSAEIPSRFCAPGFWGAPTQVEFHTDMRVWEKWSENYLKDMLHFKLRLSLSGSLRSPSRTCSDANVLIPLM